MTLNDFSAAQADRESGALQKAAAGMTADELSDIIAEAIRRAMPAIRVYVLESDITAAQDVVKTVVRHAKF